MTDQPPLITVADLAAEVDLGALDGDGKLREPLVLVDLDGAAPDHARAIQPRARLLVGVTSRPLDPELEPLLRALDLTLTSAGSPQTSGAGQSPALVTVPDLAAAVRELAATAASTPQAAVGLGQVLRASESLPVPAALDVESLAYSTLLGGAEFARWLAPQGERSQPGLPADPVLVRRDGARLLVTLNRPDRRNAYGRQLRDALADALRVAVLDPSTERVVVDGAGPAFCSGGDLAEFGATPDLATAHFVRTQGGAALLVHALRARTEMRVHGPCVGAGVELPAFAGFVSAAPGTTFRLPEVAMGLIPGAGGTVSIPRRIGRWRTLYLGLTGRSLDVATALDWGLVDAVSRLAS